MAAPSMSMNKVIHCAVRRDLKRFRAALDAFADGDKARAAALLVAWRNFDAQLTEHHEGEHAVAWPALEAMGVADASIKTFDEEHERMAADLAAAGVAMEQLGRTATRADADAAAAAMAKLESTTVAHLDHEEQETEPVLAANPEHPAYKQMSKQFSRRSGPATAGTFFAWMDDGATAQEKSALRESVPGPVLTIIGGLFGRKYRKEVAPVWASTSV
jgi:hemerythrin-like domain-containing protein